MNRRPKELREKRRPLLGPRRPIRTETSTSRAEEELSKAKAALVQVSKEEAILEAARLLSTKLKKIMIVRSVWISIPDIDKI